MINPTTSTGTIYGAHLPYKYRVYEHDIGTRSSSVGYKSNVCRPDSCSTQRMVIWKQRVKSQQKHKEHSLNDWNPEVTASEF